MNPDLQRGFLNMFFNMTNQEMMVCNMYQLKFVLLMILFCITTSCLMGVMQSIFGEKKRYMTGSGYRRIEGFSNDSIFAYDPSPSSVYRRIELTAPNTPEGNPSNLLSGTVTRIITGKKNDLTVNLYVKANLYRINGNIFGSKKVNENKAIPQKYQVYLKNGDEETLLKDLKLDGDRFYKIKMITKDQSEISRIISAEKVLIKYIADGKEVVILHGSY